MGAWGFYIATLVVYFGIDVLSGLSINLQFGRAGIPNFGYIMFQAVGAYAAAVTTLGSGGLASSYQHYILGSSLPFPLPLVVGALAGAALSVILATFVLRRVRRDYQAAIFLILSIIATQFVTQDTGLFNGANGLSGIPQPFFDPTKMSLATYDWAFAGGVALICVVVFALLQRLERSDWGRALRAVRDNETAAESLGFKATALKMQAFVIGGLIAGLSGALLVEFIGAWSPDSWSFAETFAVLVAVMVGGLGNNWGVLLGTLAVPIIFQEVPSFLPQLGYAGLINALQWVVIGGLWMLCLAFRPRGLLPERRIFAARLARRVGLSFPRAAPFSSSPHTDALWSRGE